MKRLNMFKTSETEENKCRGQLMVFMDKLRHKGED